LINQVVPRREFDSAVEAMVETLVNELTEVIRAFKKKRPIDYKKLRRK
jgi:hypothetical protein